MSFKKEIKKLRASLITPFARMLKISFPLKTSKLIMTLLTRNEADIIASNIEFHLRMGVDHIIATDNGSTDETVNILKYYERQNVLTLIHEPLQNHNQALWVRRMADIAYARFGACYIFHCDADEFWLSKGGNLKSELSTFPLVECLTIKVNNVLPLFNNFNETFPADCVLNVFNPLPASDIETNSQTHSLYIFPYPDKVLYRAKNNMPYVEDGNHRLTDRKTFVTVPSTDILIYHFPVRGFDRFKRKVVDGGSALLSNTALSAKVGWHWRRWYKSYLEGKLKDEYRLLVLDEQQATHYSNARILIIDTNLVKKLGLST